MRTSGIFGAILLAIVGFLQGLFSAPGASADLPSGAATLAPGPGTATSPGVPAASTRAFPATPLRASFTPASGMNTLPPGLSMRYLIGADNATGAPGYLTLVPFHQDQLPAGGPGAGYCNLFDESGSGSFGPYLAPDEVAAAYGEGRIDPRGPGWETNLRAQFERRRAAGFRCIELDNSHAYDYADVVRAIDLAASFGLGVLAKNPIADKPGVLAYVGHPNVIGIVVEADSGDPAALHRIRMACGKPDLPVFFVCFGDQRGWGEATARAATAYSGMDVSYSAGGEYVESQDLH